MTSLTGRLVRVAQVVSERTSDLLCAPVYVLDPRGVVLASSEPGAVGLPAPAALTPAAQEPLRVPIALNGETLEFLLVPSPSGEPVSPRLAQAVVELMVHQTTVVDSLPNQHELKNKFIHDLLRGAVGDEPAIIRQAQILGMDLGPPRAVILIDASEYILAPDGSGAKPSEAQVRRREQLVISSVVGFFMLPNDTICGYIGNGEVAVLKASNTKSLRTWAGEESEQDVGSPSWANLHALKRAAGALLSRLRGDTRATTSIGIGRYHPGLGGLAQSYQDARAALSLGRRFHGPNRVHCLDGLGIAAFVGVPDERTKVDLARHVLSPLDAWPELLDTVEAFFEEDCCPSKTAHRLSIHRNTLGYRLDKIGFLTGLDPRHFDAAVQIRLALALRSLHSRAA
jgi:carbohydrate diacid regulator